MVMERRRRPDLPRAGVACLGNPLNAALWLARTMVANGAPLKVGDVLMTGALGPMAAVAAGDVIDVESPGSVSCVRCSGAEPGAERGAQPRPVCACLDCLSDNEKTTMSNIQTFGAATPSMSALDRFAVTVDDAARHAKAIPQLTLSGGESLTWRKGVRDSASGDRHRLKRGAHRVGVKMGFTKPREEVQ